jgi:hypothetical protein
MQGDVVPYKALMIAIDFVGDSRLMRVSATRKHTQRMVPPHVFANKGTWCSWLSRPLSIGALCGRSPVQFRVCPISIVMSSLNFFHVTMVC